MTTPSLPDDLIGAFVSAAVADEVRRSAGTLNSLDTAQLASVGAELTRLRAIVAEQAATITALRQQLDEARQTSPLMPTEELVAGLASAVTNGTAGLTGYVMAQARLSLRTSLTTAGGGALVTGEPTLADPHLLSTIDVTLRAVPPAAGQGAADDTAGLRSAAEAAQAALEPLLSRPGTAGRLASPWRRWPESSRIPVRPRPGPRSPPRCQTWPPPSRPWPARPATSPTPPPPSLRPESPESRLRPA